jgi:hypothetical protein
MTSIRRYILTIAMVAGCQRDFSATTQASTGGDTYGSGGVDANDALDAFLRDSSNGSGDAPNDCNPPCAPCTQECKNGQCADTGQYLCPDGWCAASPSSCPSNCNPPCAYCVENCVDGACVPNHDVHLCADGVSCETRDEYCPNNCDPPCQTCTEWCSGGNQCKDRGFVLCGDVCMWPGSVCPDT